MTPCSLPHTPPAELRDDRLSSAIRYAFDRSPFYRARLEVAGIDPDSIRSTGDLRRIPITEKRDLVAAGQGAWCVSPRDVVDVTTTSGTTGAALLFPLTRGDIDRLGENEALSFQCAGLGAGDTVILGVTMDRCFMAGLAYFEGLRRLGATAVRTGAQSPALICQMIERTGATAIVSVPSLLAGVAAYAEARAIDLAAGPVRKLICIGEPVRDAAMEPTPLARRLGRAFGATVFATYGATELVGSMCECDAGRGGHLHPHLYHVEILDDDDEPVAPGRPGQMVVTTLGVEAMPLIRYRLGDVSALHDDPCPCGRATPRLGPVIGRLNQRLKVRGTTVYPASVQQVLAQFEQVADYLMIATSDGSLSDELDVLVALRRGDDGHELIGEALRGELKVRIGLRIVSPDVIQSQRTHRDGRKRQVFVDRR